ncbi:MAG: hypothetical protein RQ728_00020 [Brevefilum sp.]|nr:hypothetical protein [Brevefilum sp.]MDT8380623.1 hypothetical protein [Brevefilum sp.]MDW7755905.1 hypothetical protein [Brevefilum sp.]
MNRRLSQGLFILSLLFLAIGLFGVGWSAWPAPWDGVTMTIPAGILPGAPPGKTYASHADYILKVSWPRWMRLKEDGNIKLFFSEVEDATQDGLDRPVQVVIGEANLAGLPIEPTGQIQTNLGAGQDLELWWAVPPIHTGDFSGELILSFGFFEEESPAMITVPVAVVDYEIKVISLFGMERNLVLWLGFVSLVLWGALFVIGRAVQR